MIRIVRDPDHGSGERTVLLLHGFGVDLARSDLSTLSDTELHLSCAQIIIDNDAVVDC